LLVKLPKIELFVAGTLRVPLPSADGSLREPNCLSRSERSTLPVGIVTYRIACTGNVKGWKRKAERVAGILGHDNSWGAKDWPRRV
jgi:hypothetical protein